MASKKLANRKRKMGLKASAFAMALLLAVSQVGIVAFAEDEAGQSVAAEVTENGGETIVLAKLRHQILM